MAGDNAFFDEEGKSTFDSEGWVKGPPGTSTSTRTASRRRTASTGASTRSSRASTPTHLREPSSTKDPDALIAIAERMKPEQYGVTTFPKGRRQGLPDDRLRRLVDDGAEREQGPRLEAHRHARRPEGNVAWNKMTGALPALKSAERSLLPERGLQGLVRGARRSRRRADDHADLSGVRLLQGLAHGLLRPEGAARRDHPRGARDRVGRLPDPVTPEGTSPSSERPAPGHARPNRDPAHDASRPAPALQRLGDSTVEPWLYSAPALIVIITVMLVPLVVGISYAFRDVQILNPFSGGFVGLDHFRDWRATRPSAARSSTPSGGPSSPSSSARLRARPRASPRRALPRTRARAGARLPAWAVPTFLTGLNWAWLFNPTIGPLPHWLYALGILAAPDNILSDPDLALWVRSPRRSGGASPSSRSRCSPRSSRSSDSTGGGHRQRQPLAALPFDHPSLPRAGDRHHCAPPHRLGGELHRPHHRHDRRRPRRPHAERSRATSSPRRSSASTSATPRRSRWSCSPPSPTLLILRPPPSLIDRDK